jgi:hypothetical protein
MLYGGSVRYKSEQSVYVLSLAHPTKALTSHFTLTDNLFRIPFPLTGKPLRLPNNFHKLKPHNVIVTISPTTKFNQM